MYFTLRYGLRGFVFADLFQTPIVGLGSLILFGGTILLAARSPILKHPGTLFHPILAVGDCALFAAHVIFLNLFFVVLTEPHWLRLWIFRQRETQLQAKSVGATGTLWILLMVIGLFASSISGDQVGEPAVIGLLTRLSQISPIFLVAFWLAGTASLFSSADAQIYSFLVVREFNCSSGKLGTGLLSNRNPLKISLYASITFTMVYWIVRLLNMPFEKIIFLIMPLSLNVFPALLLLAIRRNPRAVYTFTSVGLYGMSSVIGLMQPASSFFWTLLAALMPMLVGVVALLIELPQKETKHHEAIA
jgi:hypothetical protein